MPMKASPRQFSDAPLILSGHLAAHKLARRRQRQHADADCASYQLSGGTVSKPRHDCVEVARSYSRIPGHCDGRIRDRGPSREIPLVIARLISKSALTPSIPAVGCDVIFGAVDFSHALANPLTQASSPTPHRLVTKPFLSLKRLVPTPSGIQRVWRS